MLKYRKKEGVALNERNHLANNIKKYRKLLHLTQAQLAEKLFVTAQNVSKWEMAKSTPDIENLCKLSQVLNVSVDRLLGLPQSDVEGRVMIAIDGGGTKTEFVLFTEYGRVLKRLVLGGTNPNSVGIEQTQNVLKNGLDQLLALDMDVSAVYGGIAGCASAEHRKTLRSFFKKNYPYLKYDIRTDILNVIYTSEQTERCIAVICGTGSVVYAKEGEDLHRLGGWGYLFDTAGSGYDYGREAICAALAEGDGIGPATRITPLVEERLGKGTWDSIHVLYTYPKEKIASFASVVFEAHRAGDAVAAEIVERNTDRLALLINHAFDTYDCGQTVLLAGGLTAHWDVLEPYFRRKLRPELTIACSTLPQIYGASALCCHKFAEYHAEFRANFEKTYEKAMGV